MTTKISASAVSRLLHNAGFKRANTRITGWSSGFEVFDYDSYVQVWYSNVNPDAQSSGLTELAKFLNDHHSGKYLARIEHPDERSDTLVIKVLPREGSTEPFLDPASAQDTSRQYAELSEDDLIDLLAHIGDKIEQSADKDEVSRLSEQLGPVIRALKTRRKASAPARERIGEYLRQRQMVEAERQEQLKVVGLVRHVDKEPFEEIDNFRHDPYANVAVLKISDLVQVVQPLVRDSKADFFAVQQQNLRRWKGTADYRSLTVKQKALMECVAKGHLTHGYRGWRGEEPCCRDVHGSTINSFIEKRHIVTSWTGPGYRAHSFLILKKPA